MEIYATLCHSWAVHPVDMLLLTARSTAANHIIRIPMATLPQATLQLVLHVHLTADTYG
jgi:hypothetical protein